MDGGRASDSGAGGYIEFVEAVLEAAAGIADAAPGQLRAGLTQIASALDIPIAESSWSEEHGPAKAMHWALWDLQEIGLVDSVALHNGSVTRAGREAVLQPWGALHREIHEALSLTNDERELLARLLTAAAVRGDGWVGMFHVDPSEHWEARPGEEPATTASRMWQVLGDLHNRKLLGQNGRTFRPTYLAAVLLGTADPRDGVALDLPTITDGWVDIERRIGELKLSLYAARTDDDQMAVGVRAREIVSDAVAKVYDPSMAQSGEAPGHDPKARLACYMRATMTGEQFESMRAMLRATIAVANTATHGGSLDRAAAVAATQGALAFVRTLQALESARREQV